MQMRYKMKSCGQNSGFTLIELLIVVAIIAILAAIAVPNFLEAQTRAKVSAQKSDLRTIDTAIATYSVDSGGVVWPDANDPGRYNPWPNSIAVEVPGTNIDFGVSNSVQLRFRTIRSWVPLTTPIAYTTTVPYDKFLTGVPVAYETFVDTAVSNEAKFALMTSVGPDKYASSPGLRFPNLIYDPSNGTVSVGEVIRATNVRDIPYTISRVGPNFTMQ